jgi:tagatose 1,6-diphosphate aldolase
VTDENAGGRKSKLIPDWSVEKISKIGGDAVKLLIWYRPDAHHSVNEHQQRLVKQVGDECRKYDKVLLLELLVYPLASDEPGFLERSRSKLVQDSLRDFSSLEFGVDIYKLEPPAQINSVPDPHGPAAAAYQKSFDQLSQLTSKPWVLLSAAAGPTDFMHSLTYAYRANASGYLCGRAIWQAAFEKFPNFALLNELLIQDSVRYVNQINELTDKLALPWIKHPAYGGDIFMPDPDSMLTNSFSSFYVAK